MGFVVVGFVAVANKKVVDGPLRRFFVGSLCCVVAQQSFPGNMPWKKNLLDANLRCCMTSQIQHRPRLFLFQVRPRHYEVSDEAGDDDDDNHNKLTVIPPRLCLL